MDTSQHILQKTLHKLDFFSSETGFKFSKEESTVIVFSRNAANQDNPVLLLDNHIFSVVNKTRILGLIFDVKLSWTPHIKKANSSGIPDK